MPALGLHEQYGARADRVSARVLGTTALVFGLAFGVSSVVRPSRPDPDVLLIVLSAMIGIVWLCGGVLLWLHGLRRSDDDS